MRRRILLITTVLIVLIVATNALSVLGCEPPPTPTPPPPPILTSELIAGQHYDAGYVEIWLDGTVLHVDVITQNGWELEETHLYVGGDIPKKAAPGKFPYKGMDSYEIDLAADFDPDLNPCSQTIYIALHAVVSKDDQSETAWADTWGIEFGKGWAMYIPIPSGPLCPP